VGLIPPPVSCPASDVLAVFAYREVPSYHRP